MKTVWQYTAVEEGVISLTISTLRKALGDKASEPKYIETIPKRGYRFIAPVRVLLDGKRESPHSETITESLVRIFNHSGKVVGTGFLVSERYLFTTAHVVTEALNISPDNEDVPSETVLLDIPWVNKVNKCVAQVVLFKPHNTVRTIPDAASDVALLELKEPSLEPLRPVRLVVVDDVLGHDFRAYGFPIGYQEGLWVAGRLIGRLANGLVQIEVASGPNIGPGFSGAAVWDEQAKGVVGMVVAVSSEPNSKVAYAVPTSVLIAASPIVQNLFQPVSPQLSSLAPGSLDTELAKVKDFAQVGKFSEATVTAQKIIDPKTRLEALISVAEAQMQSGMRDEASATYSAILEDVLKISDEETREVGMARIAPHLVSVGVWTGAQGLDQISQTKREALRAEALIGLAPFLPDNLIHRAVEAALALKDPYHRAQSLTGLIPHLNEDTKKEVLEHLLPSVQAIEAPWERVQAIASLTPHLPLEMRDGVIQEGLLEARTIEDSRRRTQALRVLLPSLPEDTKAEVLVELKSIADSEPRDEIEKDATGARLISERIEIATRALTDAPSKVDWLRFSDYADALADFIKNEKTAKPLTLAIDAAWGMGKTTLMEMVKDRLLGKKDKTKFRDKFRRSLLEAWKSNENGFFCTAIGLEAFEPIRRHLVRLKDSQSFRVVWFDAWKYDKEGSLWAALVLEIFAQIRKQFGIWQRSKFWLRLNWYRIDRDILFQSALKGLMYGLGISALGLVIYFIASLLPTNPLQKDIQDYIRTVGGLGIITAVFIFGKKAYKHFAEPLDLKLAQYVNEPNYKERVGFLAQFEDDFKCVIDILTESGKWPLVVFIDDLDRCAPPKPVEIVEAINSLVDAKYCVFIIGMDAQAVACSIEAKYKDLKATTDEDPGGLTLGERFLEKIVQINFRIPRADEEIIDSFVANNLTPSEDSSPPRTKEKVAEVERLIEAEQRAGKPLDEAAQAVQSARPDIAAQEVLAKAKQEIRAKSFDDSEEVRKSINDAVPYLGFNPRKIKRFINIFRLQALIANRRGLIEEGKVKVALLSKLMIIATRWPDVIDAIVADWRFIERLRESHRLKEELSRVQSAELAMGTLKSESWEREKIERETNEKIMQAKLNYFFSDPLLKRLSGATDLIRLLNSMTDAELALLPEHLHITKLTARANGGQEQ